MKKCLSFVAVAAVLAGAMVLGLAGVAQAYTTWDGGGDGTTWNSPNNWDPDGVPSGGDEIRIDNGAQIQSTGDHSNNYLRVGYGTVNGRVKVTQTAGTVSFPQFITLGPTGTYELQGGSLSTPYLIIGFDGGDSPGNRSLFVLSGGTLSVTDTLSGVNQRVGDLQIVGSGGTIDVGTYSLGGLGEGWGPSHLILDPNGNNLSAITVSSGVTLGNQTLSVAFSANPTVNHIFTVIDKTSGGAIPDTFLGLGEGATFDAPGIGGNVGLKISYVGGGGDNNNVTLEVMSVPGGAVPEPAGLGLIGLALLAVRKHRS